MISTHRRALLTARRARYILVHTMNGGLKRYLFHIRVHQLEALQAIEQRDGVPVAEQIRRGIDLWLRDRTSVKGQEKAERPRARTRKRS